MEAAQAPPATAATGDDKIHEAAAPPTFQGVVCCCLNTLPGQSAEETIIKRVLGLDSCSTHHEMQCYDLKLKNKYYQTTIHLFDSQQLSGNDRDEAILQESQAIILHGDGQRLSLEQLDEQVDKLKEVGGEPRLLLLEGIDSDCAPYVTLRGWCIANGFDFIDCSNEDCRAQIIDSLSAHKWTHLCSTDETNCHRTNPDSMGKLEEFGNLLSKLIAYRDQGRLDARDMDDIADILSNLTADDGDE